MKRKVKTKTLLKFDGLNEDDKRRIRTALRKVWHWSYSRKICIERARVENDFSKCEACKKIVPKVFADHIQKVGDVGEDYIGKLFVSSSKMQAICKKCHTAKTKEERRRAKFFI